MLPMGNEMFFLNSTCTANNKCPFTTTFFTKQFHGPIDFSDDCRVLRLSCLKDFRDARQAPGDILCSGSFAGSFSEERSGNNTFAFIDFDVRPFGKIIKVKGVSFAILQNNLRMQVALVFSNDPADVTTHVFFQTHGVAFPHILVADLSRNLSENGNTMGIPLTDDLSCFDFSLFIHHQRGTRRNLIFFHLSTFGIKNSDLTIAG